MSQSPAGAEPFADGRRAGRVGAAAMASPAPRQSMRPWAEHLAAAGLHACGCPGCPGTAPPGRTLNDTRWPDWYAEIDGAYDDWPRRCDTSSPVGCRWAARWSPAGRGPATRRRPGAGEPGLSAPSARTPRSPVHRLGGAVAARHRQRHQEGRRDRARLRPHAVEGVRLAAGAVEDRSWPTWPRSPRRCCSTTAARTTSSTRCRVGCCTPAPPSTTVTEVILDEQLPRGHAGQRRASDLRRQRRVHPSSRCRPARRADTCRDRTPGPPRPPRQRAGLRRRFAPVADVDPRLADHLLDVLGPRDLPAYVEPARQPTRRGRPAVRRRRQTDARRAGAGRVAAELGIESPATSPAPIAAATARRPARRHRHRRRVRRDRRRPGRARPAAARAATVAPSGATARRPSRRPPGGRRRALRPAAPAAAAPPGRADGAGDPHHCCSASCCSAFGGALGLPTRLAAPGSASCWSCSAPGCW